MFLIGKNGVNGPAIGQLRKETITNINGAGDSHLKDPVFVKAAKDMHEAKLLAEGGFKGSQWSSMEQRYERAEKEFFTRLEGVGREIENRVTGNDSSRIEDQRLKTESTSAAGYGSAEHEEEFAETLTNTGASETQIRSRLAARNEGTHPPRSGDHGQRCSQGQDIRPGAAAGSEMGKDGLTR